VTRADAWLALCTLWLATGLLLGGVHAWSVWPPIAAYLVVVVDGIARPGAAWLLPLTRHGPRGRPQIALTFDDGPDPAVTPRVLDLLRNHGARATFFLIGRHAEAHPALVRRILAEGHELGNHSYGHSRLLNCFPTASLQREIERGETALRRVAGTSGPALYRPPVGLKSPWLARVQRRLNLRVVTWSLHARDTGRRNPAAIAARVVRRARPGDIVLLHDGHDLPGRSRDTVAAALEAILAGLQHRNLQTVTVGELLAEPAEAPRNTPARERQST